MQHPINQTLTPELDGPVSFGGEESLAYEDSNYYVDVADAPVPINLSAVLGDANLGSLPAIYSDFELWLIPHRVAIHRRRSLWEVTEMGMEIEYQPGDKTLSIVHLMPGPKFLTIGSAGIDLKGEAEGDVNWETPQNLGLPSSLRLGVSGSGQVALAFTANVSFPVVSASGVGSTRCAWRFQKEQDPLFGRDIECWSLVAISRMQEKLTWKTKVYVTLRALFFPKRIETGAISTSCRFTRK